MKSFTSYQWVHFYFLFLVQKVKLINEKNSLNVTVSMAVNS